MEDDPSWDCTRCTLRNESDASACAACGATRGAALSPASSLADSASDDDDACEDASDADYDYATGGLDGAAEAAYTVSIHVARRKWEETEARRVAGREQADGVAGRSHDERQAAKSQIFSSPACFRMLSEELFKIKSARSPFVDGDAEGDDVHVWRLRLGCFSRDTPLGADLAELARRFPGTGADCVELRLRYKADLFPFYPPSVDVVRPRLLGGVRGALMAHPLLRPSHWKWTTTCSELLDRLRGFLELHGRVDLSIGAANDPATHPAGAHCDPLSLLDGALVHMGALHSCIPEAFAPLYEQQEQEQPSNPEAHFPLISWAAAPGSAAPGPGSATPMEVDAADAPPGLVVEGGGEGEGEGEGEEEEDLPSDGLIPRKRKAPGRKYYWSKGTGYGYDGDGGPTERWDPAKASATQEAQDEATQRMASQVTQLLRQMRDECGELVEAAARCVARSALAPLLAKELRGRSIVDMAARGAYYSSLLCCIVEAARIGGAPNFGAVADRLAGIETQAKLFFRLSKPAPDAQAATSAGPFTEERGGDAAQGQGTEATATSVAQAAAAAAATAAAAEARDASDDAALAQLVLEASDALRAALSSLQTPSQSAPPCVEAAAAAVAAAPPGRRVTRGALRATSTADAQGPAAAAAPASVATGGAAVDGAEAGSYVAALGGLLLDTCPSLSGEHHYRAETKMSVPPAAQQRRVAKECAGLAALLPCTPSSSVFVRAEEASTSLWRALITGPEGTPYAGGCFVFDIFFPSSYPQVPPKVNLCTTGGGSVRFNPNLYNCGKVCLSLLGTWHGGKGEGWDPAVSSVLQVLISIQSLILVAAPYYNEPGYERSMGTPAGDAQSREYNAHIRESTIRYAMLEQLRKPKAEFAPVVRAHFGARKAAVLAECRAWVADAQDPGRKATMERLVKELEAELGKL